MDSICLGTASVLDDHQRREIKLLKIPPLQDEVALATDLVIEHLIYIPRLIRELRQVSACPGSDTLTLAALDLAVSMHDLVTDGFVDAVVDVSSVVVTNRSGVNCPETPTTCSINYYSQKVFALAVFYYQYCINFYGIVQRLFDLRADLTVQHFHCAMAEQEDIRAARCLAASTPYAFSSKPGARARALRIYTPITMAYSTWYRQGRRSEQDAVAHREASLMQHYCIHVLGQVQTLWKSGASMDRTQLDQFSETFVGGPTLPQFSRRERYI